MSLFKKAVKSESKLRLAIAGPSGSGKTYTSLTIAKGLAQGGEIALIDTEHGSASKYADLFPFDVAEMSAPYHPDKYIRAINEAAESGYKVIILDSLTHAWNGTGGLLDIVEQAAARMKTANTYAAWKEATPIQNRLIDAMLGANIHIIATMRSKQEYVLEENDRGYKQVTKKGMAPIQRDGMEYEFDIFLDMDISNRAVVQKSRCPGINGGVFERPNGELSRTLLAWLGSGEAVTVQAEHVTKPAAVVKPVAPPATNGAAHRQPSPEVKELAASVNATITKVESFDDTPNATTSDESIAAKATSIATDLFSPSAAQAWAIEEKYCSNEFHARNRWQNIVKEKFSNKVDQRNVKAVILDYIVDCLSQPKVQIEQPEAA
jgi:hypothetical protein